MLVDFFKGNKKTFTNKELLDVFNKKYSDELKNENLISGNELCRYSINPVGNKSYMYSIQDIFGNMIIFVDDKKKNIVVNVKNLFTIIGDIQNYREPVFKKTIGG